MSRRVTTKEDVAAVIALYKADHDTKFISEQTGVGVRVVQNLIKRFREEGEDALPAPKPKTGRPKLVSPRTLKVISRQVKAEPFLTARQVKEKNPGLLSHCSLRCVQQALHDDLGFKSYRARKKPALTQKQMENRVKFCKKYAVWDLDSWRSVLWSDEATFSVTGSGFQRVYRQPGSDASLPQYTVKTLKFPPTLMVWACFSYHGVGELVILPKNVMMNQYNYLELLCDYLPDSFEKAKANFFMQDGAPCHTAKSVKQWLNDCEVPFFSDWPGSSPDLNPIENLWSIVKQRLKNVDTSTIPRLEAAIRDTWANIPSDILHNLADCVPKRLKLCKERKGKSLNN